MNAKQHGRIWKWIQNNLEIYRNLERAIYTSLVQKLCIVFYLSGENYEKGGGATDWGARGGDAVHIHVSHYQLGPLHRKPVWDRGWGGGRLGFEGAITSWAITQKTTLGEGLGGGLKQFLVHKSSTR